MSPTFGDYIEMPEVSRHPTNPSIMCNLFGCKLGERVSVYKTHGIVPMDFGYYECSRCGERHGVATGSISFNGELASLNKK